VNVLETTTKDRSSNSELSKIVIQEFDRAFDVQKDNFKRGKKAWRRYFPVNFGKWDDESLKVLQEEFRQPVQFDISSPKVDTLAGSLIADLPDPSWVPVIGQKGSLTEAIALSYYTDKDLYNYDNTMLLVFRDALVHAGDMEIYEDYKYHTPRIAVGRVLYGFLVWDPYWLTDDDRDAEVCYRVAYMTADKIIRKFKNSTDEILKEVREYRKDKSNYPTGKIMEQQLNQQPRVGDEFQVIEKHYIEHIKTTRLIGRKEGQQEFIPFPIKKERAYLEAFAEVNRIDWTTVIEDTYEDKIHYVTTVCRELANASIQQELKSKIQVNGLPFYHCTARRWAGMDMGIPESMEGAEDTINKRESQITELISKANGGSTFVNENLIKDPKQRQEWIKKSNKPGHKEFADLDAVKTHFIQFANNQYPSTLIDQVNRMYDKVVPLVSRVSDALSSITDNKDSGILFERKFQVNMIANTLMNRNFRQFINNFAEGYFYQWPITYGGYENQVVTRDGKRTITLNQRRGGMILNDVTTIPRCRVVISENAKSPTYQMRWRSIWAEMMQSINPQVAPAHYMMALKNFFDTIQTKDDDKEEIIVLNELAMMIARLELIQRATSFQTQAQSNTLQSAQIDMQMQQIMQQVNQMAGNIQELQPTGHMEPMSSQEVQYPKMEDNRMDVSGLNSTINPPSIEAVSAGAHIPPAVMTGAHR